MMSDPPYAPATAISIKQCIMINSFLGICIPSEEIPKCSATPKGQITKFPLQMMAFDDFKKHLLLFFCLFSNVCCWLPRVNHADQIFLIPHFFHFDYL